MRMHTTILVLVAALPRLAAALDLTPIENWREQEGVRISTLIFNDPTGKVRYQPPADWRISGGPDLLSLYPSQQEAFMQLRIFGRKPQPANATGAEDLAKWTLTFLPQDATTVEMSEERPSPFTLSGRPSREFIYTYTSGGRRFQTGVAVCDLDERERLLVIVTARAGISRKCTTPGSACLAGAKGSRGGGRRAENFEF